MKSLATQLENLTEANNHIQARLTLCEYFELPEIQTLFENIENIAVYFGYHSESLLNIEREADLQLKQKLQHKLTKQEFNLIWSSL